MKLNPDSSKNQEWTQLMLYDMSTNEIIPITNKEQKDNGKEAMLIGSIEDQVFYFTSYKDENMLNMSEYENKYKSTLNYSFYLDEHTGKKVYAYNRKTKEVEKLVEGKGIDFAHQNAKYKNSLVYRQGNNLKNIDIKTKKITMLYTIANLETIRATLDNKVFFSTLNDKMIYIYYYDFQTKK